MDRCLRPSPQTDPLSGRSLYVEHSRWHGRSAPSQLEFAGPGRLHSLQGRHSRLRAGSAGCARECLSVDLSIDSSKQSIADRSDSSVYKNVKQAFAFWLIGSPNEELHFISYNRTVINKFAPIQTQVDIPTLINEYLLLLCSIWIP